MPVTAPAVAPLPRAALSSGALSPVPATHLPHAGPRDSLSAVRPAAESPRGTVPAVAPRRGAAPPHLQRHAPRLPGERPGGNLRPRRDGAPPGQASRDAGRVRARRHRAGAAGGRARAAGRVPARGGAPGPARRAVDRPVRRRGGRGAGVDDGGVGPGLSQPSRAAGGVRRGVPGAGAARHPRGGARAAGGVRARPAGAAALEVGGKPARVLHLGAGGTAGRHLLPHRGRLRHPQRGAGQAGGVERRGVAPAYRPHAARRLLPLLDERHRPGGAGPHRGGAHHPLSPSGRLSLLRAGRKRAEPAADPAHLGGRRAG